MAERTELQAKLQTYNQSLSQVEAALAQDPDNEQYKDLQKNLREYIDLTKDLLGIKEPQAPPVSASSLKAAAKEVSVGQYVQAYYPAASQYVNSQITDAKAGSGTCEVLFMGYQTKAVVQTASLRQAQFPKPSQLIVGTTCEGIYSADGLWYNARIDQVQADGKYFVTYTDYGNSEALDIQHIRMAMQAADGDEDEQAGQQAKGSAEKKRKEPDTSLVISAAVERCLHVPRDREKEERWARVTGVAVGSQSLGLPMLLRARGGHIVPDDLYSL